MKTMKKILSLVLAVAMIMAICSVGAFADDGTVSSVTVTAPNGTSVLVGDTLQLKASVSAESGTATTVKWESATQSVATVSENGLVTAVAAGTSVITAKSTVDDTKSDSVTITVSEKIYPTDITAQQTVNVLVGKTATPTVTYTDPTGKTSNVRELTWAVVKNDDDIIAFNTATGLITGYKEGQAKVSVKAKTGTGEAYTDIKEITVNVTDTVKVTLDGNTGMDDTKTTKEVDVDDFNISTANGFLKEGYGFAGWYTLATGGTRVTAKPTENVTLYAHWTQVTTASSIAKTVKINGTTSEKTSVTTYAEIAAKKPVEFTSANTISKIEITGVTYSPSGAKGTLTVGGTTFSGTAIELKSGKDVSFTAGTTAGTATVTYKVTLTDGEYTGAIVYTIQSGTKDIAKSASASSAAQFTTADFAKSGTTLSYVTFDLYTNSAYAKGTLSCAISGGMTQSNYYYYYVSGAYLPYVTFTPSTTVAANTVIRIPYTASYADGSTMSGNINITVTSSGKIVTYTTAASTPVTFSANDFTYYALTGTYNNYYTLNSISFDMTSKLAYYYGTLTNAYYSAWGTSAGIKTATGAYVGATTFTPNALAATGVTVEIPFTATFTSSYYSIAATTVTGTVRITIGANSTVNVTTTAGTPYTFKGTEFDTTGATLTYLRFTSLPSAYQGTLYYGYNSATKTGTAVTTSDLFYRTGVSSYYKLLSGLTFVPGTYATNGTTITIPYVAYYSNSVTAVTGNLVITVGSATATVKITYSPSAGSTTVAFNAKDFQTACTKALGSTSVLKSVSFKLPTHNTLYYKASTTTVAQAVKATDVYNYAAYGTPAGLNLAGVYLSYQGFAPTSITYVGTDTTGKTFTGTVEVTPKTYFDTAKTTYKTGMYKDVTESKWYGTQNQGTIKSIVQMGLMKGYETGEFKPEGNITLAEAVAMAARLNSIYNGGTGTFTQASGSKWYQVYVDYCVSKGIIKASDFTNYNAKATRAQMAYIFANAVPTYELVAINNVTVPDVKTTDSYGTYIYRLYNAGVLTGYKNTTGYKNGAFAPTTNITRAEVATIVSRIALPSTRVSQSF